MQDYESRLKIPIIGTNDIKFLTKSNLLVATGYKRIVIGARGPYIEFDENQINRNSIYIPENEIWRINDTSAFYIEYRTPDRFNVKIYFQKKVVNYADYIIGYYYISPFDLKTENYDEIIKSVKSSSFYNMEKFF